MRKTKKKAKKQPASTTQLAAAIASQIAEANQGLEADFEARQQQCQMVTNMSYSMADSLDSLIDEMTAKCKSIHEVYKFEEKRYWNMIQQGVKGIRRLTDKAAPVVAEAYANEADIVALLHKLMYDRCTTDKMWYQLYLILKALPSRMGYQLDEKEERFAFMQLTDEQKELAKIQLQNNIKDLIQ